MCGERERESARARVVCVSVVCLCLSVVCVCVCVYIHVDTHIYRKWRLTGNVARVIRNLKNGARGAEPIRRDDQSPLYSGFT
jgi:hypothetical protein